MAINPLLTLALPSSGVELPQYNDADLISCVFTLCVIYLVHKATILIFLSVETLIIQAPLCPLVYSIPTNKSGLIFLSTQAYKIQKQFYTTLFFNQ